NFTINLNQDLASGKSHFFLMDTTNNLTSKFCEVIYIDPEGVVFDSVSNNPIKGAVVTLYNASTNQPCIPGVEITLTDTNPYTTGANGYYNFNAINGNYYLRVSAVGYTFPSVLSSFPRAIAAGSKGEQFTVAGVVLTINLPVDAQNSLLKIEKDANKKEVVVGDIITYTVTIKNETASDITNVYLEDKIPPGFKYINGKVILDNTKISDPTGDRPLTFNIGTIAANTTRTLKYQLVEGSGVAIGNY
ncbi:MAG: carboxypeptidase regulatory-like domain-containing protein, partial [Candidatus Roizmanbacteria bacterium]|nr:carboxypeptidase regulatory-like domain-containing protein [Candidatus Roizmanbacteria bacterium]